jgi:hypothetical protein
MSDNGGPAFPVVNMYETELHVHPGMTLLDHFAGEALKGRLASGRYDTIGNSSFNKVSCDALAVLSYKIAAAMIEERKNYEK